MTDVSLSPVFQFHSHNIRTTLINSQPWFVAKDVATALGIKWTGHSLGKIPDSWQGVAKLTTPSKGTRGGGTQTLRIISESAVYKLAFRSNKTEADVFMNWIASEVLPTLRKTGEYKVKQKTAPKKKTSPSSKSVVAYDPVREEINALLKKADFYIREVDSIGKEVLNILTKEYKKKYPAPINVYDNPMQDFQIDISCSLSSLFSSINFNLRSIEDIVAFKRQFLTI